MAEEMTEEERQQFTMDNAGAAAMMAVFAQVLSEVVDEEFSTKLERACERGYRLLGEEGSHYHEERKAAAGLRVLGSYLRQIEDSKTRKEWSSLA